MPATSRFTQMPVRTDGRQTTTLRGMNDSTVALSMQVRLQDGSWKHMSTVDPSNMASLWRASGERWRLYDPFSKKIVASATTVPGTVNLYAPSQGAIQSYSTMQPTAQPRII